MPRAHHPSAQYAEQMARERAAVRGGSENAVRRTPNARTGSVTPPSVVCKDGRPQNRICAAIGSQGLLHRSAFDGNNTGGGKRLSKVTVRCCLSHMARVCRNAVPHTRFTHAVATRRRPPSPSCCRLLCRQYTYVILLVGYLYATGCLLLSGAFRRRHRVAIHRGAYCQSFRGLHIRR